MSDSTSIGMMSRTDVRDTGVFTNTARVLGGNIRFAPETGSTNGDALEWARGSDPRDEDDDRSESVPATLHGAVVLTDHQTAGRGRFGRSWSSARSQNLLASVILYQSRMAVDLVMVPVAAAVSAAEALKEIRPELAVALKWPNDILSAGSKCGGILIESTSIGNDRVAVTGFGINLNQTDFPERLQGRATSILLETGRRVDRNEYFHRLMARLEANVGEGVTRDAADLPTAYRQFLTGPGESVRFRETAGGPAREGVFAGVESDGAARIEMDGRVRIFHAGEVTFSVGNSEDS